MSKTTQIISIKPQKGVFFIPRLLLYGFLITLVCIFSTVLLQALLAFGVMGVIVTYIAQLALFLGFVYWWLSVSYKKTTYQIGSDKIIYKTGSPISDKEVELPVKNITHLRLQLPFIWHWLFKTGNIYVESAGSDASEGKFLAISDSSRIYGQLQSTLQENGFSLQKTDLKETMKPSILAVVFDTIKFLLAGALGTLYVGGSLIIDDTTGELDETMFSAAIVIGIIVLCGVAVVAIFRFIDLKKRVYKVYEDAITYREGFLTKNQSIIPFENLTDSLSAQSIVDRMFGLYDVALSCQGAKKEIKFKNIIKGDKLAQSIRTLVQEFKNAQKGKSMPTTTQRNPERVHDIKHFDKDFSAEFKMNALRTLLIPGAMVILAIIVTVFVSEFGALIMVVLILFGNSLINLLATTYTIDKENMHSYFRFLRTREVSFLNEKITSVLFRESWIDMLFGTCQIEFGSIGSAKKIKFKNLKKQPELFEQVRTKVGINPEALGHELRPAFGFFVLLKSNLFYALLLILFLIGGGVIFLFGAEAGISTGTFLTVISGLVLVLVGGIYAYLVLYYKRANLQFFDNYIRVKKGVLIQTRAYAAYKNIKDIETVKYPLTKTGSINFNVAGEDVINQETDGKRVATYMVFGRQAAKTRKFSHGLALKFIGNIPLQNNLLDHILWKPMTATEIAKLGEELIENPLKSSLTEKPSLSNTLFWIFLLAALPLIFAVTEGQGLILGGLLIVLLLISVIVAWVIKAISFEVQSFRVLKRSGIFYKKQISVLYSKIDHINQSQGLLNKIFKNGNIAIYTIGSSKLEVGVKDLGNYRQFYEKMKEEL